MDGTPWVAKTTPWRHQIAARNWAIAQFQRGLRTLELLSPLGGGKTLAALLVFLGARARRALVVAPEGAISTWARQVEKHLSSTISIVSLDDDAGDVVEKQKLAEERLRLADAAGVPCLVVVGYDTARQDPFSSWAESMAWDMLLLDEAHVLRLDVGRTAAYYRRLAGRSRYRLALTSIGIPREFPLRVDAHFRVGEPELPRETSVTYSRRLGFSCRRIYASEEKTFLAEVQAGSVNAASALEPISRLQAMAGGIVVFHDRKQVMVMDDAKERLLAEVLRNLGKEPAVVFCRHRLDVETAIKACQKATVSMRELSGWHNELARWRSGDGQVLVAQIDQVAGADLSRARYVIYYSLPLSLGEYDNLCSTVNSTQRSRPVTHIHLVTTGTVDEKIVRAIEGRVEIIQAILDEI
jgi:superfamily II DNA or RNA helicase